jgi:AraC family transcriptional regulator
MEAQPVGPSIGPYERLLWSNPAISLGSFDAAPHEEGFETAGAIGDRPAIAFSCSSVGIAQVKRDPFVSDGTVAVLHNPRHPYRRFRVDRRGDHCEWVSVDPEVLLSLNPGLGRDPRRPFAVAHVPLSRRAAALVRLASRHVREWTPPDELWVEETLYEILSLLAPAREPRRTRATTRHDGVVRNVRELLSSRPDQPWTVSSIAKVVGASPFHVCRVFRRRTGYTLHGYLTEQRLRRALTLLGKGQSDLRAMATSLGFSSHSHFTAHFRAAFGATPSRFRRCATPAAVRALTLACHPGERSDEGSRT